MKFLISLIFFLFSFCIPNFKEVPSPLKGSYENPILVLNLENFNQCLENWEKKDKIEIILVEPVLSLNFHFLDVRDILFEREKQEREDLFKKGKKVRLRMYFDQYQNKDECNQFDLKELIKDLN